MVDSRTATAAAGLAVSFLVSGVLWWYFETAVFFLFLPFVPILLGGREDVATVAGIGAFLLAMEGLALVPTVGSVVQLGLLVVGFGAVVNTYFGVTRFDPAIIPDDGGK